MTKLALVSQLYVVSCGKLFEMSFMTTRELKLMAVNLLTVSRIVLALIGIWSQSNLYFFGCSLWASASDFLDGFITRKYNLTTRIGEQLDQISDKIFHLIFFFLLARDGIIHFYFFYPFAFREIVISVLRRFDRVKRSSNFFWQTQNDLVLCVGFNVLFKQGIFVRFLVVCDCRY